MARRELDHSPDKNGEYWLLAQVVAAQKPGSAAIFMDVGANVGDWSARAVHEFATRNCIGHVHAFEPTTSTFAFLGRRFKTSGEVTLHNAALSDRSGIANFFVVGECAGTNSLVQMEGATMESVRSVTFDEFVVEQGVERVTFVKCDTEGYDFNVMTGASESLREGRIDVWQFEYNHLWIASGTTLKDVFDFIADKPYQLGKLYGYGLECYSYWHPELDRFFATNYVLVRKGSVIEPLCERFHFDGRNTLVPV